MPPEVKDRDQPLSFRVRLLALAFFIVVASVTVAVAYRDYVSQKEIVEHQVRNQLLAVADLKVSEIADWSERRMEEVRVLMADTATMRVMQRLAAGGQAPAEPAEIRTWLNQICLYFHYSGATFADLRGNTVLSVGKVFGDAGHIRLIAEEVVRTNRVVFHDLRTDTPGGGIHMGLNVPLRASRDAPPFGALLLSIDPSDRLYPLLRRWPVVSQSGEVLLVRREGDEALFLNDLRFRQGTALRLRLPLSRKETPAVQSILGAQGIVTGSDYRGVPVIAAVRPVPDLPWFLVAKMDTGEVEAPIRRRSQLLILAVGSLLLAAGAAALGVWRRQQLRFYRTRYEADLERQALVGHYDYLSRFANDIILLMNDEGRILEANDRAVGAYGFTREELLKLTVRDLRHPSSTGDFTRQWNEVRERGSLVFESVHRTRLGHPFPVEVSVRLIRIEESEFRQSIIRDITERKTLDERLRRMLDEHTTMIESSAAAIVTLTPECRIASWNKSAERIFGWTAAEAVGAPPLFVPAERMHLALAAHEGVMRGEVIAGRRGLGQRKDGRSVTLTISSAALHDRDGRVYGAILNILDITEQAAAEESLRRNEALFRATFDQAAVGMNFVSLDGQFLRVNPRYCQMLGYSQEELLKLRFQEITYPHDLTDERERAERLIDGRDVTASYNKRYIRKDGSLMWLHVTASLLRSESGEPLHFVGVVEDVTERLRAEEALRHSEERFRCLVESAPEGILVERARQILYVNSAAVKLFGAATAAELQGRDLLEFALPEDRDAVIERSDAVLRQVSMPPMERCYLRTDGTPFPVEVSAAPIEYDQQPAAVVFLRDIAERKQAEVEKRRLEEQLLQVQKLESLGRLAGGVAHDFNNHLTVIAGYCDMLLMNMESASTREEVEEIRTAAKKAAALTQQLLAFSRKQMAERKPLQLNHVVEENRKMLCRLIGEGFHIVTSLDAELGLAVADRGQMEQVLMNLMINARDAMPAGGNIVVETANADVEKSDSPQCKDAAPGAYVRLSVADSGVGMSEETLQHVFEPFFTTKCVGLGTGLGLSTVYGVVRQTGGWIHVKSKPAEGTLFQIYLPRVAAAAEVPERPAPLMEAAHGSETVLLAEDQPEVRRLALRILKSYGYRVLEAASGPEALDVSRRNAGPIDLLVTDVIMPEMTGHELSKRLRELRPQIKVLYVSGYTADLIGHEGALNPGVDYLPKPYTSAQLALKVREVLGQSSSAGRILVLDDDDGVRGFLQQTLTEGGYQVVTAGDGREGMRLVAEQPFDLVLTDLIMPDQEGIETIRRLRRDFPSIRIVAMSGAVDSVYLKTAELLGADVTLPKPIDSQDLLRTVRELLT